MLNLNSKFFLNSISGLNENDKETFIDINANKQIENRPLAIWERCLLLIGPDVIEKIFQNSSFKDILAFEQASKNHKNYTYKAWEYLRERDYYQFDWQACDQFPQKQKANYLLSEAFIQFIDEEDQTHPTNEKCNEKFNKWKSIGQIFPIFRTITADKISVALNTPQLFENVSSTITLYESAFSNCTALKDFTNALLNASHFFKNEKMEIEKYKAQIKEIAYSEDNQWGGETLLQIFFESQIKQNGLMIDKTKQIFINAINKKATYAALLTKSFFNIDTELFALKAAEKKDFRALEQLVEQRTFYIQWVQNIVNQKYRYGPLLAYIAKHSVNTHSTIELLYDEALENYGNRAPANILHDAAIQKCWVGKKKEADRLLTQAVLKYGDAAPFCALKDLAVLKYHNNHFQESDKLFSQIFPKHINNRDSEVLQTAIIVKCLLEKFFEADTFLTYLLPKTIYSSPHYTLTAVSVKYSLGQSQEADEILSQFFANPENDPSARLLYLAASVKFNLGQTQEADKLCTQALLKYGHNVPSDVAKLASLIKINLKM